MNELHQRVLTIAESMHAAFPDSITPYKRAVLERFKTEQSRDNCFDIFCQLRELFDRFPYSEIEGDDETLTEFRTTFE